MITPNRRTTAHDVASHYDDLAAIYLDAWGEHVHHGLWTTGRETAEEAVRALVAEVAAEARIGAGAAVCDVGCGYGATARQLAQERGARVTGLTISKAQLDFATQAAGAADNPRYLLRDWMQNDLPDGSFDAVVAIESSEHMEDKARFFSEAGRVLRPGGRLVVCAWLAADAPRPWQVRHLLEPICSEGRIAGLGTEREYTDLLQRAGLRLVRFQDVSRRVQRTWPTCAGRLAKGFLQNAEYRDFLFHSGSDNSVFAITILRIWAAYTTGSMRYGIFTGEKPPAG